MVLVCCWDPEYYVELSPPEVLVTSVGTERCIECGELIHVGVEHYFVRQWFYDDDGDEIEKGQQRCCEACGDLAFTILELGYCWSYGDLREGIREMNLDEGRLMK